MQTLFIGFAEDAVNPFMKSAAIRIAYLLSAQLRLGGDLSFYFYMEEQLRKMSFEGKLKFIDERDKDSEPPLNSYKNYKDIKKVIKKTRSPGKELLVLKKKMEISGEKLFNILLEEMMKTINESGLPALKDIEHNPDCANYYIDSPEREGSKENENKLSELLQLELDEKDTKSQFVFVLNYSFFSLHNNVDIDELPVINEFAEEGFLQEIFAFPSFNHFSVAELNSIRSQAGKSREDFQQLANVFANMTSKPAEAFEYVSTTVLTAAKKLEEDINNSNLVASYNQMLMTDSSVCKVYLGMISLLLVHKYFQFVEVAKEETINILNALPDEEKNKLVPVLILNLNKKQPGADEILEQTEDTVIPLKKSLSIE